MTETLYTSLIQSHLSWENPAQNRSVFEQKIAAVSQKTHLIILPEMFTTGFTMNASGVAETMDGETVQWLKKIAQSKQMAICGSIIITENNNFYNRFLFVYPDGSIQHYDKHQLFTLAKEQEVFTAGQEQVIIDYLGWKIKPLICYDLRFPVWARNTVDYDLLIYVASWPRLRIDAWDTLLKARAIENMSYCIGVNRVGLDGNGYEYNGHSGAYDVLGNSLIEETSLEKEVVLQITLEKSHIEKVRSKLSFLKDRDTFQLY